mmetsp:Transcript_41866/g.115423  ORF Transcript_41866/g.115423 Transcript_41866/m.115423 type:complete len:422 (-) Transcript_41866:2950-4215(-)|eukprot:1612771-Prymnesium_polylepis.4
MEGGCQHIRTSFHFCQGDWAPRATWTCLLQHIRLVEHSQRCESLQILRAFLLEDLVLFLVRHRWGCLSSCGCLSRIVRILLRAFLLEDRGRAHDHRRQARLETLPLERLLNILAGDTICAHKRFAAVRTHENSHWQPVEARADSRGELWPSRLRWLIQIALHIHADIQKIVVQACPFACIARLSGKTECIVHIVGATFQNAILIEQVADERVGLVLNHCNALPRQSRFAAYQTQSVGWLFEQQVQKGRLHKEGGPTFRFNCSNELCRHVRHRVLIIGVRVNVHCLVDLRYVGRVGLDEFEDDPVSELMVCQPLIFGLFGHHHEAVHQALGDLNVLLAEDTQGDCFKHSVETAKLLRLVKLHRRQEELISVRECEEGRRHQRSDGDTILCPRHQDPPGLSRHVHPLNKILVAILLAVLQLVF